MARRIKPQPRFDPDVRFLLANERTLLAWIRTAIGLEAGGVLLAHLGNHVTIVQKGFSIAAIALGALMAVVGYLRFKEADRAIRAAELPSIGYAPVVQMVVLLLVSLALIALIALDVF